MGIDRLCIICTDTADGIVTRAIFRDVTIWEDVTFASKDELARYVTKKLAHKFHLSFVWQRPKHATN